jgi:hypothetical protein
LSDVYSLGLFWILYSKYTITEGQTAVCLVMLHFIFFVAQRPLVVQGLLIAEVSRSYSDTLHSVGLLWTSGQPVAETSARNNTQHPRETDLHVPCGIRTRNPSKRAVADPRLKPRGHWDRHRTLFVTWIVKFVPQYYVFSRTSCETDWQSESTAT